MLEWCHVNENGQDDDIQFLEKFKENMEKVKENMEKEHLIEMGKKSLK